MTVKSQSSPRSNPMPSAHAILSPSAAHRWMHCTAAPRLEEKEPDRSSVYAEEGSLAHEICECKLRAFVAGNSNIAEEIYRNSHGVNWDDHPLYNPEMEDYTDQYVSIVLDHLKDARKSCPDATLWIEESIDLSDYIPEGFGTSDAGIIADGFMEVFDFKYGKGVPVSADRNPQMMVYALGAYKLFEAEYDVDNVKMTIVQPRIGNLSSYEIDAVELLKWGDLELKVKAKIAFEGKDTTQEAGEWCKFCAVKRRCKALAEYSLNVCKKRDTDARLLSLEEIADILKQASVIENWLTGVKDYALEAALEGESVPGFKIVEGRSVRKVSDITELTSRLLTEGFQEAAIFQPRELQTITTLEKMMGKKKFAKIAKGCITKPTGKPTLAFETDKRPEYKKAAGDFADIIE